MPGNLHCKVNPKSILKGITLAPGPPRVRLKELLVASPPLVYEEVAATITKHEARAETQRCLQCGSYCYSHTHINTRMTRRSSFISLGPGNASMGWSKRPGGREDSRTSGP